MTKKHIELQAFADKLQKMNRVVETNVHRKEIEATLFIKNPQWGLEDEIVEFMENDSFSNKKWGIVDFSHIEEIEVGYRIKVYIKPFN